MKTLVGNQKWFGFTLVSLLILSLCSLVSSSEAKNVGEPRTVRLFYFLADGRPYRPEVVEATKAGIVEIQEFFAEQMTVHGYGNKTFQIETDDQSNPVIHRVDDLDGSGTINELHEMFDLDETIYLVVWDQGNNNGLSGKASRRGKNSGYAFTHGWDWFAAAHELGHAFGLTHDYRDDKYVLSYGRANRQNARLSQCAAQFLSVHTYFNPTTPIEDTPTPTVEFLSPAEYAPGTESVPVRVKIRDSDGVHQAILRTKTIVPGGNFGGQEVKSCRGFTGQTDVTFEFNYDGIIPSSKLVQTSLSSVTTHTISVEAVDKAGNTKVEYFTIRQISDEHIATLEGHEKVSPHVDWITFGVNSVAFSPDGTTLASGSDDTTVKLWHVETRAHTTLDAIGPVNSVAFSPDGTILASGGGDYPFNQKIQLWNIATRTEMDTFTGHTNYINSLAFSRDGAILASGSSDDTVKLWDMTTRTEIDTLEGHTSSVSSVAFSPDGTILASGSWDNTVKLWDVATRTNIATFEEGSSIYSVAFSPDGATLATGATDKTVRLWNLATQAKITTLGRPNSRLILHTPVAFSPDGTTLATLVQYTTIDLRALTDIRLWDVTTQTEIAKFQGHSSSVLYVAFSPDGTKLASGSKDATVRLWNTSEWAGMPLVNHPPIGAVAMNGTAEVGETLTADASAVTDPDGPSSLAFSYQWLADASPIIGATAQTYILTQNDFGKMIRVRVSYIDGLGAPVYVASDEMEVLAGICGRTEEVRNAILDRIEGVSDCALVTDAHLAAITGMDVTLGSSVKAGDFDGLTGLTALGLDTGQLTVLPAGVLNGLSNLTHMELINEEGMTAIASGAFDGLTNLTVLGLNARQLTSLPAGILDSLIKLTVLEIITPQLNTLPVGVFDRLTNLTNLTLYGGQLNTLPDGIFDQLTKLTTLALASDQLTSLPDGIFDRLTKLTSLRIGRTQLTSLPEGLFSGLSSLTSLDLSGNAVDPMPLTVTLEKVGTDQFKAVAPPGASFDIVLPITVTNGTITSGATTVTIPVGSVESDTLTISGTTFAVTVNIGNLPGLPTGTYSNGLRLHKGYVLTKSETVPIVFGRVFTPVSERTLQVQNAILKALPDIDSADDVTGAHLATITGLGLGTFSIFGSQSDPALAGSTAFQPGDFDGLTSLTTLAILEEDLSSIPAGVFDELVSLETLMLFGSFSSLPIGVFDGMPALTSLFIASTQLNTLPMDVFDGLSNLTTLGLVGPMNSLPEDIFDQLTALRVLFLVSQLGSLPEDIFGDLTSLIDFNLSEILGSLPAGVFDNLTALTELHLGDNQLTSLPAGIFDGLTALTTLNLENNQLTGLPEGVFKGLSSLTELHLTGNPVDPLPLTVSLEKGTHGQFKAVAPTGAPFDIVVPLHVQNGSITGAATSTTIPKGSTESGPLTVTRTPGTTYAVTANIGNPLPTLPSDHDGYTLVKSDTLPLVFTEFGGSVFTPISERTPQVRDAIVAEVPGVNNANDVTEAHLAAITRLSLDGRGITALKTGDFDGLTSLTTLVLSNTPLSSLPSGIFDNLSTLTLLNLSRNQLSSLPAGIFDNLTTLTSLNLSRNQLSSLPSGIFDNLSVLTQLDLSENQLSSLPAGIFDSLSTLTRLELNQNQLSSLPADIFDNLSALTFLNLFGNQLSSLPAGIFDNLTALTSLYLDRNQLSSLPSGIFNGLTALEVLALDRNPVDPLPLTVSLEQVGGSQFKAVAPTGAPFDIILPLSVTNGTINGGATTITIPQGSVESELLTISRTPGATAAVTVDVGTLPSIPTEVRYGAPLHKGYTLVKSTDLPLTLTAPSETTLMAIKGTITNEDGTPAEAGLQVTVTIGSDTKPAVSEAGGVYSVIFLSTQTIAISGDTVTVQVSNPNTGAATENTIQLSAEQISVKQATIDLQFSSSEREYRLSLPAGISFIHVPLKVTAVEGVPKTLESVGDLYDALGGASTVSLLITHGSQTGRWVGYFDTGDRGTSADKLLTDDLGIIAVMTAPAAVLLSGDALGTNGQSAITLHPEINLVGIPLNDSRISRVSDLLALEGVSGNVTLTIVSDNGEIKLTESVGDSGDIPVTGAQSFILVTREAATVEITGVGWSNVSDTTAAPLVALRGIEMTDTTPVLAVTGSILPPVGGASLPRLGVTDVAVTVKNLSTGKLDTAVIDDDGAGYRFTFVDIETGRAAQVGDILEITAHSPDPLIGVHPVRHTVTGEDVKRSWISLDDLVAYEIPAQTELLLNYPNPFNPETWIPYRLAKDAFVTLTIYDAVGRVVRDIAVGHRIAAVYESRSKAIYWDGRTEFGERVASGIYFYTLTAGDYTATRKMVILK